MKKIAIVSYGRKGSLRCPNKLLRPFVDTTLMYILLSKLGLFGANAYFGGYDEEFKGKCRENNVNFIQRTERSVSIDEPLTEVFGFVRDVPADKIMFVNGCLPFLSIGTMKAFLAHCEKGYERPALAVLTRKNYFFDQNKAPLFKVVQGELNTKAVKTVYECANALYYFDKQRFFDKGFYWNWDEVDLVSFDKTYEFLDIDTEDDFKQAELIYLGMRGQGK
jgi:hypothetical protein